MTIKVFIAITFVFSFSIISINAQDEISELEKELKALKAQKKENEEKAKIEDYQQSVSDSLNTTLSTLNYNFIAYLNSNNFRSLEANIDSVRVILTVSNYDKCQQAAQQAVVNICDYYAVQGKMKEFYKTLSLLDSECSFLIKNYIKLTYFNFAAKTDSAKAVVNKLTIDLNASCFETELDYNQKLECYAQTNAPQFIAPLLLLNISGYKNSIQNREEALNYAMAAHNVASVTADKGTQFAIDVSLASIYLSSNQVNRVYKLLNPYEGSVGEYLPQYQKEYYRLKAAIAEQQGDQKAEQQATNNIKNIAADMESASTLEEQIEQAYQNYEMEQVLSIVDNEYSEQKSSIEKIIEQLEKEGNYGIFYAKALVLRAHALTNDYSFTSSSPKDYLEARIDQITQPYAKIPVYEYLADETYKELDPDSFKYYRQLVQLSEKNKNTYLKFKSISRLAFLSDMFEMYEEATSYYEQALTEASNLIDQVYPFMTEEEQFIFNNKWILALERSAFTYYTKLGKTNGLKFTHALADFRIKIKGLLLESAAKTRLKVERSDDRSIKADYAKLIRLKQELASKRGSSGIEEQQSLINEIKSAERNLQKQLGASIERKQVSLDEIKQNLKENEIAIEVVRSNVATADFLTDSINYYFLIIRPDKPTKIVVNRNGNYLEGQAFDFYLNAIQYQVEDHDSYTNYWSSIAAYTDNIDKVYLSMDGVYNGINLGALYQEKSHQYLYETTQIIQLSTLRDLTPLEKIEINYNPSVFVGRPDFYSGASKTSNNQRGSIIQDLPGTEKEIELISNKLNSKSMQFKKLLGANALEGVVKNVRSPKILHIATHGFYERVKNPSGLFDMPMLSSGLMLTGAGETGLQNGEDGILTAYEISSMSLSNTEMVILSACESGVGEHKDGQGVYGISRAFLTAGAQSVISTLWKVDDTATQQFMNYFYTNWLVSGNKYEAMNYARNNTRKAFSAPYYWAGFIITGMD